jgi:c-di-GMP-binding flagellar brake protein YcgR
MQDKPDFKVKLGDLVQLQFIPDDGRDRLNAKVIGHVPNKALIISSPGSATGKLTILRENQRFVVRMLQGNRVYGFEAEVLKYYTLPYPHVHLSHPTDIECITVRGARRINTSLVVSLQLPGSSTPVAATLSNLSTSGAQLQTETAVAKLDDKLSFSIELVVSNLHKYLRINSIIRNLSTPQDRNDGSTQFRHGVQFLDLDDDQKLIISAYVHEQLVKQMED